MDEAYYNNRSLFSSYYIEKIIYKQTSDSLETTYNKVKGYYSTIAKFANSLNEPQTEEKFIRPVLKILDHSFQVQPILPTSQGSKQPDYVFFSDEEALKHASSKINTIAFFKAATAVGDAKSWGINLDKKNSASGDPFSNSNPNYQIDFYIRTSGCTWGILTNGNLWRLYHRDTSYKLDCYYEVNLEKILLDDDLDAFRYFYFFFRASAFSTNISNISFLDNVLSESIDYTVSVSDDLGKNIYSALETLINGFVAYPNNSLSTSDIKKVHENCLILLYRLLFVLYAESRELLPLENTVYQSNYSLNGLATEIHQILDKGNHIPSLRTDYWTRLQNLFTLIDKGWEEHIPQYNGGLFNPNRHSFLQTREIGNETLANVVDKLTRTIDGERIAYQDLAIQHLGNIYEGLLEYKPVVKSGSNIIKLEIDKSKRKASGSYYTSDAIVRSMVENALDSLCSRKTFDEILQLKILDPAMGSGHFLVGVIDHLALELATHPNAPPIMPNDTDTEIAYWRRRVVENCIYGVDSNPMTVELAKLTLWLHTVAKGEPLSFLDHHIRCGNSLIGVNIADLATLPNPTKQRYTEETIQIPFDMQFPFIDTVSEAIGHYLVIESMESSTAQNIYAMEKELHQAQQMLSNHKQIANLWLSVYFGNSVERSDYHFILGVLKSNQPDIPTQLSGFQNAQSLAEDYRYFHWEIEFPEVFRDKSGIELENPGFDAIIGNPPYGADLDVHEKKYLKTLVKKGFNSNSAAYFIDAAKNRLLKSDGVIAFIAPKSLLYVENWQSVSFELLENTSILVDVQDSFKGVKLEQVVFIYDKLHTNNIYTAYRLENETWRKKACVPHSYPVQFQTLICDVSQEEIQIGLKLNQIGMFLRDISETKRGLPLQNKLSESGDIPVIGGKNIKRFEVDGIKNYLTHDKLDPNSESLQFLKQPKVMSQKIIAFIQNPKPHIQISATVDLTGDILNVDTVINTILTDENFTPIFISAILNSALINWYTHKFIFSSAIRTMTFDSYYVGKIPIPCVTLEQQSPICKLAKEIMVSKQTNLNTDISERTRKIDELVYELYGLEKKEKEIVKASINLVTEDS